MIFLHRTIATIATIASLSSIQRGWVCVLELFLFARNLSRIRRRARRTNRVYLWASYLSPLCARAGEPGRAFNGWSRAAETRACVLAALSIRWARLRRESAAYARITCGIKHRCALVTYKKAPRTTGTSFLGRLCQVSSLYLSPFYQFICLMNFHSDDDRSSLENPRNKYFDIFI